MAENKLFRINLFLKIMSIGMKLPMIVRTEPASEVLLKVHHISNLTLQLSVRLSLLPYITITCINQDITSSRSIFIKITASPYQIPFYFIFVKLI